LPARSPVPSSQAGLGSGPGKPASSFMPHSTSVPIQDLKSEAALLAVPRMELDGKAYPALSGIPLLAKLGQGGMGSVYYGVHPRLRKEVAVKILPLHMAGKPDLVQRFFREAQTAAQIQSPHLVGVLDVNEESGHFFLVMEFVSGLSAGGYLRQVKEQGRAGLSEHEVLMIALAAAEGLAAAHAAHIIHRDIKPDNILIPRRKSGREGDPGHLDFQAAKLADLGLARADEMGQSLTGDSSALGTPGYMAPEQAMDAKNALAPADVFSVGATMYSLLSGRAPFTGNTAVQVIFATVKEPHTPFAQLCPHVRPQTAALIERCLAKNPAERFADGAALRDALKACLSTMGLDEPTMRMPKGGTPSNIPAAPLSTPHTPSAPPMRAAPGSAPVFTPPPIPAHTPQPPSQGQRPSHLTPPVGPDGLPPRTGNLIPPRPIGNVPAEPKRRFALNGLEWAFMVFLLFGLNVLGVLQCSYVQLYYGLAGFTVGLSLLGMCAGFMLRFSIGLWLFLLSNILFVAGMTASAYFIGQEMEDQDTVIQGWIMLGCIVYSVGAFCCSGLASLVSAMRSKDA
jgi:serine/threonine protein kinase